MRFIKSFLLLLPLTIIGQQNKANYYDPVWSPDGSKIAFYANSDGDYEIYIVGVDGSNITQITHNEIHDSNPSWSPDGKKIMFSSKRSGNSELFTYDLRSAKTKQITFTEAYEGASSWSPNGKLIAFEGKKDGINDIYIMKLNGKDLRNMTKHKENNFRPGWSLHGKHIYFSSKSEGIYNIYRINIESKTKTIKVFKSERHTVSPNILKGNKKMSYLCFDDDKLDVYLYDLKTKKHEKITNNLGDIHLPSFSSDGKLPIFNIKNEIYTYQLNTSKLVK